MADYSRNYDPPAYTSEEKKRNRIKGLKRTASGIREDPWEKKNWCVRCGCLLNSSSVPMHIEKCMYPPTQEILDAQIELLKLEGKS